MIYKKSPFFDEERDFLCPYVKLFLEELGFTSYNVRKQQVGHAACT